MQEMDTQAMATCQYAPSTLRLAPYNLQSQRWPDSGRHVLAQTAGDNSVVVYQAYSPAIGEEAARRGRFAGVPGFLPDRMTWIKTNFLWMMFRCGWATKPHQECVLAITLRRAFFEEILAASVPTSVAPGCARPAKACRESDVVLQWDPDHLPDGSKHPGRRAVQLGLRGAIRDAYASGSHILAIEDITPFLAEMRGRALAGLPVGGSAPAAGTDAQLQSQATGAHPSPLLDDRAGPSDAQAAPQPASASGSEDLEGRWAGLLIPAEEVLLLGEELRRHIAATPPP